MKQLKMLFLFVFLAASTLTMAGCGNTTSENSESTVQPHGEGTEYTSAYVCPMHCKDSGSDAAGTCPACGMDYVAQADHANDGHAH